MKQNSENSSAKARLHSSLKDQELLNLTFKAAASEKSATLVLLDYLLEVDVRKLYCTLKAYSSLFDYCVKELGLSEPAAAERVNAVRLMKSVPEVKSHLEAGRLTLTSAAQIQRFIKTEEKVSAQNKGTPIQSVSAKKDLIDACLGQSKREVEKTLFSKQSEPAKSLNQERIRAVSSNQSEIRFIAEDKTTQKINRVKELLGEKSLETIFDQALELLILKEEKKRGMFHHPEKRKSAEISKQIEKDLTSNLKTPQPIEFKIKKTEEVPVNKRKNDEIVFSRSSHSRFVPIDLKRAIFQRSKGQCEYIDSKTGDRCRSKYRLNIDHIHPFALGGKTEFKNLRHLCFNHNQRAAMNWNLNWKQSDYGDSFKNRWH